jgi:hypothetical protein
MGQEKKKKASLNENISSFDVTSVRLEKGPPARKQAGTEAGNIGPLRKEHLARCATPPGLGATPLNFSI